MLLGVTGLAVFGLVVAPVHEPAQLHELLGAEYTADVRPEDDRALLSGRRIPSKPDPSWAPPPCPLGYVPKSGACWLPGESRPPCPVATYEDAGRCWVPLSKGRRTPTTIQP